MAWKAPEIGELTNRVRIDRKVHASDGMGGFSSYWETLIPALAASATPARGGEEVRAGRMSGISGFDVVVRSTSASRAINAGDRAVLRDGRTINIKWTGDLDGRGRFLMISGEAGGLTDG